MLVPDSEPDPNTSLPVIRKGSSFLWKHGAAEKERHLRIIATNPAHDEILIVPVNTYKTGYVGGFYLQSDDHPWISLNSVPGYPHFLLVSPVQLNQILVCQHCTMHDHVVDARLLNRLMKFSIEDDRARQRLDPAIKDFLSKLFQKRRKAS